MVIQKLDGYESVEPVKIENSGKYIFSIPVYTEAFGKSFNNNSGGYVDSTPDGHVIRISPGSYVIIPLGLKVVDDTECLLISEPANMRNCLVMNVFVEDEELKVRVINNGNDWASKRCGDAIVKVAALSDLTELDIIDS